MNNQKIGGVQGERPDSFEDAIFALITIEGSDPEEARQEARRALGNELRHEETFRDMPLIFPLLFNPESRNPRFRLLHDTMETAAIFGRRAELVRLKSSPRLVRSHASGAFSIRSIGFTNRLGSMDSNIALDGIAYCRENQRMERPGDKTIDKLQVLVLERRDPSSNMARFYVLAMEPTLFGDVALVREWGRLGCRGRRRLDLHADGRSAAEALEVWLDRKARRGYRVTAPVVFPPKFD